MTDPAGNESPVDTVIFTVDTVPPVAPVISVPASGDYIATGNVIVSGTGEIGGVISIYSGGVVIATGTVNASGIWTVVVSGVSDGIYTWTGTITDPAGNEGPIDTVTFTVDTTAPPAPGVIAPTQNQVFLTGNFVVNGTGEA